MHQTVKPSRDKLSKHIGTIAYINFRQSSVQVIRAIVEHDTLKLILSRDIQHFPYTVSCNYVKGCQRHLKLLDIMSKVRCIVLDRTKICDVSKLYEIFQFQPNYLQGAAENLPTFVGRNSRTTVPPLFLNQVLIHSRNNQDNHRNDQIYQQTWFCTSLHFSLFHIITLKTNTSPQYIQTND